MWYAAHTIMRYRYLDTQTDSLVGYENILIISAQNPADAIARARIAGREDEVLTPGHSLDGRPAHLVFAGVKKVVECCLTPGAPDVFSDGNEITYNDIVAASEADFLAFIRGGKASVTIS
jgi:hypothetical protein